MIYKFRRPDDMHVHFRATTRMGLVAPFTAKHFARAVVMPNVPAITTPALAVSYREEIKVATAGSGFEPLMTLKMNMGLMPADIFRAKEAGVVAVKIYPDGVTTGSHDGITIDHIEHLGNIFDAMQKCGMVLCWHGEHPGSGIDYMDAEPEMLPVIRRVVDDFPRLKQVLEHITTRQTVDWVIRAPSNVAATITAHHLWMTHNDLVGRGELGRGGKLNPHYFCWPMAKREDDRRALVEAATSGNPKFFLGTDSAPHHRRDKESDCGCAGVFSAPVALPALASVFDSEDAMGMFFEPFTSEHGARFYGLPLNDGYVEIARSSWRVPDVYCDGQFVPFLAGMDLGWQVV